MAQALQQKYLILLFAWLLILISFGSNAAVSAEKIGILSGSFQPRHYLQWNQKPIHLIGDSVTQGWMETGSNFDQKAYIDALASRGINLVMLWTYIGTNGIGQQNDPRIGYDAPEIWPWVGSPDRRDFDLSQFNQTYFNLLKEFVVYAERKGIIVLITVHDGWTKGRFDGHTFNSALGNGPLTRSGQYIELWAYGKEMPADFDPSWNQKQKNQYFQERFCDKLISELNSCTNVIYEMFNEGEWYNNTLRNRHEQHFLAFFRARCKNLLLTNTDHISRDDPHNDSKVNVITLHGGWTNRFGDFQRGFNKTPAKPYLLSEPVPGWDGTNMVLDLVRRSIWGVSIAGAGWVNQNDSSFGWDPKSKISSRAFVRTQAYNYAGHAAQFFNNYGVRFWNMKPKRSLCSTGICMAHEGTEYVVYAPSGGTFTIDMSGARGTFKTRWYDPRGGKFVGAGSTNGGGIRSFMAPDKNDWVLHIGFLNPNAIQSDSQRGLEDPVQFKHN